VPLILRVLAWLIAFYRRWLSGRGPLRDVRCSFVPHESCSAFGLRTTAEAPSARVALRRIAGRIRRCRDACLVSDGHALSWTPLHDRAPSEIVGEMRTDGEGAAAIEQVLRTRRAVAIWRADLVAIRACDALLAGGAGAAVPRVCAEPAIRRRARRRLVVVAGIVVVAAIVVGFLPWVGGITLGLAATAGTLSARTTIERERRFDLHRTWARRR
jgi:putative component of membrane protein insertase Oxa1/YidC/SpoIIIJ protein YidD